MENPAILQRRIDLLEERIDLLTQKNNEESNLDWITTSEMVVEWFKALVLKTRIPI